MRSGITAVALLAGALLVSACASTAQTHPTYAEEMAQLNAECQARGGMLTPIQGATGPRAANDYACEIRGGPSSRLRGGN